MRIVDAAPFFVAKDEGLFDGEAVSVSLLQVGSAAERDQLLASGALDVVVNDLVSAVIYASTTSPAVAVSQARASTSDSPQFSIVAAPGLAASSLADLAGRTIGISEGTVIAYITSQLMESAGLDDGDYEAVNVPAISERLELLLSGRIDAATLPEPFTTLAIRGGARVIGDDSKLPGAGASLISVTPSVIAGRGTEVDEMLRALAVAARSISDDPARLFTALHEADVLADDVGRLNSVPFFPIPVPPSEEQVARVAAWAVKEGVVKRSPDYVDVVELLPATSPAG